jgi:DNA repair exonuclease SbcCD nuclease subunit
LGGAKGHEPYAPCALDDLRSKRYDYWALGHVHQRNVECQDPLVVFPGNLQGRHIRETGAKGCMLVTVAAPDPPQVEFRPLDVFRWETCDIDVTGARDGDAVLQRCGEQLAQLVRESDETPLGVRVTISGCCAAHQQLLANRAAWTNQIRACAIDAAGDRLWVEKVRFATAPEQPLDAAAFGDGPLGELLQYIEELRGDQQQLMALGADMNDLRRKLPDELNANDEPIAGSEAAGSRNMLDDIQALLAARLVAEGDER